MFSLQQMLRFLGEISEEFDKLIIKIYKNMKYQVYVRKCCKQKLGGTKPLDIKA